MFNTTHTFSDLALATRVALDISASVYGDEGEGYNTTLQAFLIARFLGETPSVEEAAQVADENCDPVVWGETRTHEFSDEVLSMFDRDFAAFQELQGTREGGDQ